jgi:nitrite reductase/ring-hydroxylating ferredoxin subunit
MHLKLTELPEGKAVAAHDGEDPDGLIVLRHADQVKAWLNCCPHQGRTLNYAPGKFLQTDNGNIMCAAHGAVFDQHTGACIAGPCKGDHLRQVTVSTDAQGGLNFAVEGSSETTDQDRAAETSS